MSGFSNDRKSDFVDKNGRASSHYTYTDDSGANSDFTAPALNSSDKQKLIDIRNIGDKYNMVKGSFKKGGKVKSTGVYRVHKGEKVLNRAKAIKKALEHKKK